MKRMDPTDPLDIYFTEHVVGPTAVVQLGRSATVRRQPKRGVMLDMLKDKPMLVGVAAQSLLAKDPARAIAGKPVSLQGLRNWRRTLVVGGLLTWSAVLVAATRWWPF